MSVSMYGAGAGDVSKSFKEYIQFIFKRKPTKIFLEPILEFIESRAAL